MSAVRDRGLYSDPQKMGNFLIALTFSYQLQDLSLARRQGGDKFGVRLRHGRLFWNTPSAGFRERLGILPHGHYELLKPRDLRLHLLAEFLQIAFQPK